MSIVRGIAEQSHNLIKKARPVSEFPPFTAVPDIVRLDKGCRLFNPVVPPAMRTFILPSGDVTFTVCRTQPLPPILPTTVDIGVGRCGAEVLKRLTGPPVLHVELLKAVICPHHIAYHN
ncbi:MAG: hypothetical protein WC333_07975 [Dehalococcoidia bacterium]